jgi:hypothetical protein
MPLNRLDRDSRNQLKSRHLETWLGSSIGDVDPVGLWDSSYSLLPRRNLCK